MKANDSDWFDFAILGYVQPGDKLWTYDKKWINLIKNAGCAEYLYESELLKYILKNGSLSNP